MRSSGLLALAAVLFIGPALADPLDGTDVALLEPDVIMGADPPPPFTYWAPEGSTVKNHPRTSGVWIAEGDKLHPTYYFGDLCKASQFQKFVGEEVSRFPPKPKDAVWRIACGECAVTSDLQFGRMNIMFEQETNVVTSVACG